MGKALFWNTWYEKKTSMLHSSVREKLFDMHSDYKRSKTENIWTIQILGKDKKGVSIK